MPVGSSVVSYTVKIRTSSFGAPEEGSVVGILSGERILSVTIGLSLERSDELRVTGYTVVFLVDLFACQFEYTVWLEPLYGTGRLGEVGQNLYESCKSYYDEHPY
jgi:hypothetical protein